jgi:DNA-binding IclR family transcriptional regulator
MRENIEAPEPSRRRGIQSVEVGMRVLDALATLGTASSLTAIAQASAMTASQAHRYLVSLIAAGMVQQDPQSGRYDLGTAALRLGLSALTRIDAFRITDAAITAYALQSGRTVQLAALGPLGPTIIRWAAGRPPVMTSFYIGSVLPLTTSATGQAFLAFVPRIETDGLLAEELATSILTHDEVEAIRTRVRAAGFAHVAGSMVPGLRATAFPIFDLQGRAILTATALAPDQIAPEHEQVTTGELRALCRQLSLQLGWTGAA